MLGNSATTVTAAIAAFITLAGGMLLKDRSAQAMTQRPAPTSSTSKHLAQTSSQAIELIDRVEDGSDFDEFRNRLWQAIQQRDAAFVYGILPSSGLFIGTVGPIAPTMLALEDIDSPFWHLLEKMLAPQSCELDDYPGSLPDAAVWGCPNIASAMQPQESSLNTPLPEPVALGQVAVVGRGVNVRARPRLGTSVVGRLSNEVVEFDQTVWQELLQTAPEATDDPINGWTPVILPNQVQGYVYNRYVYHPAGPRALFELVDGNWQLFQNAIDEDTSLTVPEAFNSFSN